ncbi:MAG: CDP-glucose 4,6-dehydratase [Pseudomonadota bacterium]
MVDRGFLGAFAGARVFVTGHTGFKGSWLALLLTELGAEVMGYALPPEHSGSHFELLGLARSVRHVEGDIRDARKLAASMHEFQPEFVFHLAAQALVRRSYAEPQVTFDVNVMGSVNLLEAVRQCASVRTLVYITSDKCYENLEWVWGYRENDRLGGHDPYSASKAAAELAFSAYARSFLAGMTSLGAATARAGNVIGGGDWAADRIIPDCIRAIRDGLPIKLRHPAATRPWQHVLEPISGYLLLAERLRAAPGRYAGSWNFGPPSTEVRTVREVAERIVGRFGRGSIEVGEDTVQHEAQLLQLNCDKASQLLGWRPRWTVEQTLSATADWYRMVIDGDEARAVSRRQLHDYFPELT